MSIDRVEIPSVEGLEVRVVPPAAVELRGTIAMQDPGTAVGGFFKALDASVRGAGIAEFVVDVRDLEFVNSSAIRLFVDWASRLKKAPAGEKYTLVFRVNGKVTWQRTTFTVLENLAGEAIRVDRS